MHVWFFAPQGRADVLQRQHFARYWAKGEEERQRSQSAELFDSEWQYQADGSGAQSRPTSACSDWSKVRCCVQCKTRPFACGAAPSHSQLCMARFQLPERFGINLSINLQAVAKVRRSSLPPLEGLPSPLPCSDVTTVAVPAQFTPSPAPPATRYTPSNPTAPTISEASHAVQSQRPGTAFKLATGTGLAIKIPGHYIASLVELTIFD